MNQDERVISNKKTDFTLEVEDKFEEKESGSYKWN